jgi:hypothetical protein
MSEDNYIPLRDLISESLLRDLILFFFLFLLVLSQQWDNVILLLFPLLTFAFSIFFNMINSNKWRVEFNDKNLIYTPLGLEKKHANRLVFCALFLLILVFWIGAESLYHPQLVDDYALYFIVIFTFVYTFGYYWIFIDLWKYSRIEITVHERDLQSNEDYHILSKNIEKIISYLKVKDFKKVSFLSFISFIVLNILNILTALITTTLKIPIFHIPLNLPGTGVENSEPIFLSIIIIGILIVPPLVTFMFLKLVYRNINTISKDRLNSVLETLPKEIQVKVVENLKALNKKFREEAKIE